MNMVNTIKAIFKLMIKKLNTHQSHAKDNGCICLSITEKDAIFYGRYGSFLTYLLLLDLFK